MDLHKYTAIPGIEGGRGAGGCGFRVTRWPDAQNPLAFQKNTRASGTDMFGLRAGKGSGLCCAGGGWTQPCPAPLRDSRARAALPPDRPGHGQDLHTPAERSLGQGLSGKELLP